MTLDEFVKEYEGKKIDYDGSYGAQCVDLVRLYIQLVWGLPNRKVLFQHTKHIHVG